MHILLACLQFFMACAWLNVYIISKIAGYMGDRQRKNITKCLES